MDIDRIYHVSNRPPRPGALADQAAAFVMPDDLPLAPEQAARLTEIWAFRLSGAALETLLAAARPTLLSIASSHVADLGFLGGQRQLRGLAMDWNTKLRSLDVLRGLPMLEALSLQDLKHVHDLAPLAALANLTGLQIAGGMDSRMDLPTLAPLAGLARLEDLRLAAVRIGDGSLDAIAALPRLRTLSIALNAAPMAAFARLAGLAPHIACDEFQPYLPLNGPRLAAGADPVAALDALGDERLLLVGKRMPTLRARTDRARLLGHIARFQAIRAAAR
jgi:hypothetical protein